MLALLMCLAVLGGCSELATNTARPTLSPIGAVPSPPASVAPTATARRSPAPWPRRWKRDFCAAFSEVVIAQELVVDIERALEEDEREDALALARELQGTAAAASQLIEDVEQWEPAQETLVETATLLDLATRIGRHYARGLERNRRPAFARAREVADEMRPTVERANEALEELAELGLRCSDNELVLESP
jgi:hypothetical protein